MTETVDALQEKLDPQTLKERARTRAKEAVATPAPSLWRL